MTFTRLEQTSGFINVCFIWLEVLHWRPESWKLEVIILCCLQTVIRCLFEPAEWPLCIGWIMYICSRCLVRKGTRFYQQVALCSPEGQDPITVYRCLLDSCPVFWAGLTLWALCMVHNAPECTAADSQLFLCKQGPLGAISSPAVAFLGTVEAVGYVFLPHCLCSSWYKWRRETPVICELL